MAGKTIMQTSSGASHSLALASDGTVYAWDANSGGQLGDGTTNGATTPVAVKTAGTPMAGKTIVQVDAGSGHSAPLTSDGAGLVPGVGHLGPTEDGIGAPTGDASHRPGGRGEGHQASGVGVELGSLRDETGGHDRRFLSVPPHWRGRR